MTEWPTVRLDEVLKLDRDAVKIDPSQSYAMVGVYSFGRGLFDREPVHGGKTSYKKFYRLRADHVVMSQLFGWEGALALSHERFEGKFLSPQFPTFVVADDSLDRRFLGWCFRRPVFWEELASRARGMGDRRRTVNPDALLDCPIPLPPIEEQRRIVAKIERLAAKVEEASRLRSGASTLVDALQSSLLDSLVPNGTETAPLQEFVQTGAKISYGVLKPGPNLEDGVPFVRVQDLAVDRPPETPNKRISAEIDSQYERTRLKGGEVLVGVVGSIGKVGIAPPTWAGANIARAVARIVPNQSTSAAYLAAMLGAPRAQEYMLDTTRTLAQPTLNIGQLKETPIPVLSVSDQEILVSRIREFREALARLKKVQAASEAEVNALLPSILDNAFKGDL